MQLAGFLGINNISMSGGATQPADRILGQCGELTQSPGNNQKEGHEDQVTFKQLGRVPLALSPIHGPPGFPSGPSLDSL